MSSPPPQWVMSTSLNNVASNPAVGPASPPQGQFLPLSWVSVLTRAEANPVSPHPVFSPLIIPAHLSELPTSMLLNQVSRKWLSRPQKLTCGGKTCTCVCTRT